MMYYADSTVVGSINSVKVNQIRCLKDKMWLNYEVVAFFLEWWQDLMGRGGRSEKEHAKPHSNPKCWYASRYFWPKLSYDEDVKGYYFESVQRCTQHVDLFSKYDSDKLIIPVNKVGHHLYLAAELL